jgi:hypothetical protein
MKNLKQYVWKLPRSLHSVAFSSQEAERILWGAEILKSVFSQESISLNSEPRKVP